MIRDKHRVRAYRIHDHGPYDERSTTALDLHLVAIGNAQLGRQSRMHFAIRLGRLLDESSNASCLIARKIMRHDATRREHDGVFVIRLFSGWAPFNGLKMRFAIRMSELPS